MATVALYAAGAAIGVATGGAGAIAFAGLTYAAVGGMIGGTIGAFIDNTYLFPALFSRGGAGGMTGPRVDDFQIQSAAEGTPVKFCVGPRNRIAGEIIWLRNWNDDPTLEVAVTESAGGGKGGAVNPFAKDTYNMTEQAKLIKADPTAAAAMAKAAGVTINI